MSSVKLQALAAAQDRGARLAQADPLPARRQLALGSKQYEIISEKKGSNAIIYRAYDTEGNREVAIKELDLARIKEKKVFELAIREAELLQSIDHPNVVKCLGYHADQANDKFFIITEWVEGKTLREEFEARPARGGVSDEEAKGTTSKLLDVISQLPVIHRDISPDNVMLCEGGGIKLVDFGFSLSEHSTGTTYFAIHSLGFTAPEIIQGFRGDKRSDLFSIGAIYLWMKTGKDTIDIRDMGTFNYRLPELPASDRTFLEKAIAFAPDSRFQSAAEMKVALVSGPRANNSGARANKDEKPASSVAKAMKLDPVVLEHFGIRPDASVAEMFDYVRTKIQFSKDGSARLKELIDKTERLKAKIAEEEKRVRARQEEYLRKKGNAAFQPADKRVITADRRLGSLGITIGIACAAIAGYFDAAKIPDWKIWETLFFAASAAACSGAIAILFPVLRYEQRTGKKLEIYKKQFDAIEAEQAGFVQETLHNAFMGYLRSL